MTHTRIALTPARVSPAGSIVAADARGVLVLHRVIPPVYRDDRRAA